MRLLALVLMPIVFAVCLMGAVCCTFSIILAACRSHDLQSFEAHMHHFTDRIETTNGQFIMHRTERPVLLVVSGTLGFWSLTVLVSLAHRRLIRSCRKGSG